MQRRYVYLLIFGGPALLVAIVVATLLFGAATGILWLFVFGDDPWPAYAEAVLTAAFVLGCLTLWALFLSAAYAAGKAQEARATLNPRHVIGAVGVTALLVLIVVTHQWQVGNLGAKSAGVLCAEFCQAKGYAGSGMPPRDAGAAICSCIDGQGREALTLPLADIARTPGG